MEGIEDYKERRSILSWYENGFLVFKFLKGIEVEEEIIGEYVGIGFRDFLLFSGEVR